MQVTTIGLDLAKNVFQVHVITQDDQVVFNRPLRRAQLLPFFSKIFNKDRKTIAKMLRHELPAGYRRSEAPPRPTLDDYVGVIDGTCRPLPSCTRSVAIPEQSGQLVLARGG